MLLAEILAPARTQGCVTLRALRAWPPRRLKPSFKSQLATLLTYLLCSLAVAAPYVVLSTRAAPTSRYKRLHQGADLGHEKLERRAILEQNQQVSGMHRLSPHHRQRFLQPGQTSVDDGAPDGVVGKVKNAYPDSAFANEAKMAQYGAHTGGRQQWLMSPVLQPQTRRQVVRHTSHEEHGKGGTDGSRQQHQRAQHVQHVQQSRHAQRHGPGTGEHQLGSCPVLVDWGSLSIDPGKGWSAVFTPYNIVFGGGERYLLSVVAAMQRMGYVVDVLVLPSNACQTVDKLMETARGLRVELNPARLRLVQTSINGNEFQAPKDYYSLFMALGNEKLPLGKGLGHVNFYMNQFPFDLDADVGQSHMEALSTYDYVILNSAFSYKWYNHFMDSLYDISISQYGLMPSIEILHPLVEAFRPHAAAVHSQVLHDLWDSTAPGKKVVQARKQDVVRPWAQIQGNPHLQPGKGRLQGSESGALPTGISAQALDISEHTRSASQSQMQEGDLTAEHRAHDTGAAEPAGLQRQHGNSDLGRRAAVEESGNSTVKGGGRRRQQLEGDERSDIVLVGRFFEGRQSKGHGAAIEMFQRILPRLPEGTRLHLVGNLMQDSTEYLFGLMKASAHLPVDFHVCVPASEVEAVLHSSLVQWHLTGAELTPGEDPASEEHFGISIAEGMSAGCIPVVLRRGGVEDIVSHAENGFLADTVGSVADLTLHVFHSMSREERKNMCSEAVRSVQRFGEAEFERKFRVLAQRGALSKPFRHLIQRTRDVVTGRNFVLGEQSRKAAVIVEPRHHYGFEYVVKNVMYHLGPQDWTLYVFHGNRNEAFVRRSLAGIENIKFFRVSLDNIDIPHLNQLMKSAEFWEAVDADTALVFQTDSLLLRRDVKRFEGYSYVGAPWHLDNERWSRHVASMPHGVGNGGLSLRSVPAMRALVALHANASQDAEQEDWFFVRHMDAVPAQDPPAAVANAAGALAEPATTARWSPLPSAALPDRATAYSFAVEVPCPDLEEGFVPSYAYPLQTLPHVPLGVHAPWYYFNGSPARRQDLLRLLDLSVCGYTEDAAS